MPCRFRIPEPVEGLPSVGKCVRQPFDRLRDAVVVTVLAFAGMTGSVIAPAQAQEGTDEDQIFIIHHPPRPPISANQVPITLITDAIIVQGQPLPDATSDKAYSIVTLEMDRINGTASNRIEDALKDTAGLTQFRRSDARSANATSQGATLRGLGGNASSRALLLLDGVPQTDPFGGWVTWPAFAPERLGRIKVTRGGGSGVLGNGALAGTIELESLTAATSASLSYGSRDAIEASAMLGGKLGKGTGFIAANYAKGDGFVPIIVGQRGPADRPSPYEQASFAARAIAPLSVQTELQASFSAFTDRRERGTTLSGNGGDGADASLRLVHRGRWQWQALAYVQARKFQSRFVSIDAARATVTQTVDQFNVPSTGMGTRFELRPPLGGALELRIGGDWRRTTGETNEHFTYVGGLPTRGREAGGRNDTAGAFTELTASLGNLTLTGGGRVDRWWIANGRLVERTLATGALLRNDIAPDRQGSEPTGRLGFAYDAGPVTFRGAAYLGWRLPTLNELYRPFRVGADATAANAALSPERSKGAELGLDWKLATGLSFSATAFTNRLSKAIANVTVGSGPGVFPGVGFVAAGGAYRQRQNVDAVTSKGIEIDARYRFGDWKASLSYALTDAQIKASGLALPLNGLRPAQVPRHSGSATMGWQGFSVTGRYVSDQFEDDLNRRTLNGAFTLDAVASIRVNASFRVSVRGENLTNTRIETAVSNTGIIERASPRTFWISLLWNPTQ
jgi:vitamin B12 transporter